MTVVQTIGGIRFKVRTRDKKRSANNSLSRKEKRQGRCAQNCVGRCAGSFLLSSRLQLLTLLSLLERGTVLCKYLAFLTIYTDC